MAATKYTYSVSTDFPNGAVDIDRLTVEIGQSTITTALDYINVAGDDCDIWFMDALTTEEENTLDVIVANHSGDPLPSTWDSYDALGNLQVSSDKPIGFVVDEVTPNMADKSTWWNEATPLVTVTMEDTGDHSTYKLPAAVGGDQAILDFKHGRLTNEDAICMGLTMAWHQAVGPDASAHPVIKVDGVVQTEDTPFGGAQNDYSVDYSTGRVTFHTPLVGTETVTVSCGLAGQWMILIQPSSGQTIEILQGEVQWTTNIILHDCIHQDVEVWDEDTQTWVLATFPNGLPKREVTKTIMDLLNRSYGNYPIIPKMGGDEGRGLPAPVMQVPFTFPKKQVYVEGYRVRVYLMSNTPASSSDADPAICTVTLKINTYTNGNPGL